MGDALDLLGLGLIKFIERCSRLFRFFGLASIWLFRPPFSHKTFLKQSERFIVETSFPLGVAALFLGSLFPLLKVPSGLSRDVIPAFVGILAALRAGTAITAELGRMRVTEQIDAMEIVDMNSIQILVSPRILAGLILVPVMTLCFLVTVGSSAYLSGVHFLKMNSQRYQALLIEFFSLDDICAGLLRAGAFGAILSTVGSYEGYFAQGGLASINYAVARALIITTTLILGVNYLFLP